MIKVENISVYNIARAVYSARNAMNSWRNSDSDLENDILGPNDLKLATNLFNAGPSHRKFLRQIFVTLDITAPLYWWKEADQYKVATTTNSCSTMHKITEKEFELSDFSHDHLTYKGLTCLKDVINELNVWRTIYLKGGFVDADPLNCSVDMFQPNDKRVWWQLIQLLPSSYNQRRTLTLNYETIANILETRSNHRLDEWRELCDIFRTLPYVKEIMEDEDGNS